MATGADALEAAEPDLVLLDVGLPDTDGFSLCRELRGRSEVPIIMAKGLGEEKAVDLLDANLKDEKDALREVEKIATRLSNEAGKQAATA